MLRRTVKVTGGINVANQLTLDVARGLDDPGGPNVITRVFISERGR